MSEPHNSQAPDESIATRHHAAGNHGRSRPSLLLLIGTIGLIAALLILAYQYIGARADRDATANELAEERAQRSALDSALDTCRSEHEQTRAQLKQMEADQAARLALELKNLRTQLDHLRKQQRLNDARWQQFLDLSQRFERSDSAEGLTLALHRGRMILELAVPVLFDEGSAKLSRSGQITLMEVAIVMRQFGDRKFRIGGHTDSRIREGQDGPYRNNWQLSVTRALAVVEFLIEARIPEGNLSVAGYGSKDPIADNRTDKGRRQNRRIEIELVPHEEEQIWLHDLPGSTDQSVQPGSVP